MVDRTGISEQVEDLRNLSDGYTAGGYRNIGKKLKEAADTIDDLSAKLAAANMDREMREILFKGKRKDNKEWIEGNLVIRGTQFFIFTGETKNFGGMINWIWYEVYPETVCQYIGTTDKNSKKIFERDIIEACTFGFNSERFVTEVMYDKCAFRLKNGRNMFYYGQSDFTKMDDAKVIGNIFDNPELIEK